MPSELEIPEHFLHVSYNGAHYPGAPDTNGLVGGANCQQFAYELLRHFGRNPPNFRSSELWEDRTYTDIVFEISPLDLVLFNRTEEAWGAHVGVCVGPDKVVHLSKQVGLPAIWAVDEFKQWPHYQVLIGAKRLRS